MAENVRVYRSDGVKKAGVDSKFVKLNKGFNNESYLNLLEHQIIPSIKSRMTEPFIYMHDNAPIHVKKQKPGDRRDLATRLICDRFKIRKLKWPAYSPDLNCIENVWALLNRSKNDELDRRAANGEPLPKNKSEMYQLLKRCWESLDNAVVKRIYRSFLNRLMKVKAVGGKNNFCTRSRVWN